jgi:hypothetical protein
LAIRAEELCRRSALPPNRHTPRLPAISGHIQQQFVQNPASMSGPTRTTSWSFIRKPRRPRPIHWDAEIGGDTPAPIMRSRVRRKIDAIMTMVAQITSGYTPAK